MAGPKTLIFYSHFLG